MSDPMTPEVREWMKRTEAQPPDARRGARQVVARLRGVRQRRRWWPYPVLYRNPQAPSTNTDTVDYQPSLIPAANGHTPTVAGRTQSMFSPVKVITAGALVFAIGGAMLVAQPFGQVEQAAPGAEAEVEATWVTGDIRYASTCESPPSRIGVDITMWREWGYLCEPQTWTTGDPRLSGTAASMWNADVYRVDAGAKSVITGAYYVTNEGGGWACRSHGLQHGFGLLQPWENDETAMCVGEGGYEDLSAILVIGGPAGPRTIVGLIFPGDVPPLPERRAAE